MPLKTRVKVGNISNLSDARYCAGMGVDMLGYTVVPNREGFIPAELYQEIRGWISGPAAVVELYGLSGDVNLETVLEEYRPDYLEIDVNSLAAIGKFPGPPIIVAIDSTGDLSELTKWKDRIAFVQVCDDNLVQSVNGTFDVLLSLKPGAVIQTLLDTLSIQGIALTGSDEIRPGYKDYDELARVLEDLEC